MEEIDLKQLDLLISNYAFSELSREIQDIYIDKVALKSRHGYMILNDELLRQKSPFEIYTKEQLLEIIPNSKIIEGEPAQRPGCYTLIW